jgi:hypothetical protein
MERSLIDEWLPACDTREYNEVLCRAGAPRTYAAVRSVDLTESATVRALLALRGIRSQRWTTSELAGFGFVLLEEKPSDELVFGLVGRFWRPMGGIVRVTADEFRTFDEPGFARAAWNFKVEPAGASSKLSTETRVRCTDDAARRRFRLYWRLIGPFSSYIRGRMLASIKREAEF